MMAMAAESVNGNGKVWDTAELGSATAAPVIATPSKLHGRAFWESLGSPKYVVAPMVDQSEFAWRMLTRSFLPEAERASILAYSPMLHARLFIAGGQKFRDAHFQPTRAVSSISHEGVREGVKDVPYLDGNPSIDRPLFVQFCANDPQELLAAAQLVAPHCDAVDLNLGCPQGIARKGHYGAFLQENQELIFNLVNILHKNLSIPVTAKIRILETKEATLAYAQNVLKAGASILTVHGRRRDQKGHLTGLADWEMIRFLRDNLPPETVLFANGNILQPGDMEKCLAATGADGIMSAEGNLSDPGIFARIPDHGQEEREYWRGRDGQGGWRVDAVVRRYFDILHRYVLGQEPPARRPLFLPGDSTDWMDAVEAIVEEPRGGGKKRKREPIEGEDETTADNERQQQLPPPAKLPKRERLHNSIGPSPNMMSIQAHLFHLLRHFVSRHHDVRDALGRSRKGDMGRFEKLLGMIEKKVAEGLLEYERTGGKSAVEDGPETQVGSSAADGVHDSAAAQGPVGEEGGDGIDDTESSLRTVQRCRRPWWVAQPIVRPLPKEALAKGAIQLSRKAKEERAKAVVAEGGQGTVPEEVKDLEKVVEYPKNELVAG